MVWVPLLTEADLQAKHQGGRNKFTMTKEDILFKEVVGRFEKKMAIKDPLMNETSKAMISHSQDRARFARHLPYLSGSCNKIMALKSLIFYVKSTLPV